MKQWRTKGILKFVDTRNKLHKSFVTEECPDIKNYLHKQYKSYKGIIIKLKRLSKKKYYAEYFRVNAEDT